MIGFRRRRILGPGEMFPAGDPAYRVSFPRLRSGLKVRVVERGAKTSPPVLLVHGWGCTVYVFRYNMPALAAAGIWGSLDHMMPDDGMGVYVPLLPRLVLRAIPDAGHIIPEETPDEVNAGLIELLGRAAAAA